MPKIKLKRGLQEKLPVLEEGEPGFTTDSGTLFIGSSSGNVELAKKTDVNGLSQRVGTLETDILNKIQKGEFIIYAKDYNLIGDGITDDSIQLQALFDAAQGRILVLEQGKTYGIPNEKTVRIKDNTTIISNGAKFKKTTTGSNYCLLLSGTNITIDYLGYIPFTSASETGVKITGNNVTITKYESISDSPNCGGDSTSRNALFIYNSDINQVKTVRIGRVVTKNWERCVQVRNATDIQIDFLDIDTFKQALYLRDVTKSKFNGAYIRTTSSTAVGNPGENGVLIEAYSDNASRDLLISDWVVEDTAEHGYRVGGQSIASDITFRNCVSRRPGRGTIGDGGGTELGTGHGGCGFKVLGPTSSTKRHRNIKYFNCIAEDGRTDVSVSKVNFAGFQIGKCINVIIDNPIVRTNGVNTTDRSFVNGIEIIGCEDVNINNPNIGYVLNNGIHFYDADPATAGGDFGTLLSRVNINGGFILNPVNAGIYVNASMYTFRRIRISGTMLDTGAALYALQAVKSGAGTHSGCTAEGYVNPSTTVTTIDGLDLWIVNLSGVFTATANNAANGSTFRDSSGSFKVRKAGAWVAL
jgi:hypothetical protein